MRLIYKQKAGKILCSVGSRLEGIIHIENRILILRYTFPRSGLILELFRPGPVSIQKYLSDPALSRLKLMEYGPVSWTVATATVEGFIRTKPLTPSSVVSDIIRTM